MIVKDGQKFEWVTPLPFLLTALLSLGAPYLFIQVASMVLLLETHGLAGLVIAYIGAAIMLLPAGIALAAAERYLEGRKALIWALALRSLAALLLFLMVKNGFDEFAAYGAAIWARIELIIGPLSFWGYAARRQDGPQHRRSLPWLAMGEPASLCLAGLVAPFIVGGDAVEGLFLTAAFMLVFAMGTATLLPTGQSEPRRPSKYAARPLSPVLRKYLFLVACAMVIWTAAHYLLDGLFHGLAFVTFDNNWSRLAFLSFILSAAGLLSFTLLAIGRSELMRRFGLRIIVTALPLGLLLGIVLSLGAYKLTGFAIILVMGVGLMKAVEFALVNGFYMWAWTSLFAPVPDTHRHIHKNRIYRIVHSGGALLGTACFAALLHFQGFDAELLLVVFAIMAGIGVIVAQGVKQGYVMALERALMRRQKTGEVDERMAGRRSREMIQRLLRLGDAGDAIEAARLQATLDIEGFVHTAPRLIARGDPEVIKTLLGTVPQIARIEFYPPMAGRLTVEEDPDLRDALLTAAAATGHPRSPRMLAKAVAETPEAPPMGALIGLGRHGGPFGEAFAGQFLERIALSGQEGLAKSVEAVAAIGRSAPSAPVSLALRSSDPVLRRRAIRVAGLVGDASLAPLLAEELSDPFEWRAATLSLSKLGVDAVPVLAETVGNRNLPDRHRAAAIRALGGIRAPEALDQLWHHAQSRSRKLRQTAHLALWRASAVASRENAVGTRAHAAADVRDAAEITLAIHGLAPLESTLLNDLLYQHALRQLTSACRAAGLAAAREKSVEVALGETFGIRRAWPAINLGQQYLSAEQSRICSLIIEDGLKASPDQIATLRQFAQVDEHSPVDWLGHILTGQNWPSDWIKAVAYHQLAIMMPEQIEEIDKSITDPGAKLAATMAELAARRDVPQLKGQSMSLTIVERVLILKSADLFAKVPDEELAEIAPYLTSVFLDPGEVIITEGEVGDELYIVVSGEVTITKSGAELARLGERAVFGELAALDPEPRNATVQATVPTQVLALSNEHLLALFEANVEIAAGVIATLIGRLRTNG